MATKTTKSQSKRDSGITAAHKKVQAAARARKAARRAGLAAQFRQAKRAAKKLTPPPKPETLAQ